MLVIGAKGFAIQLLDVLKQIDEHQDISFYDDLNINLPDRMLGKYQIIKNPQQAEQYFRTVDFHYALGIGDSAVREKYFILMNKIGGVPVTIVSPKATIGTVDVSIGDGSSILTGAIIESTVKLGVGTLVNLNATLTHGLLSGDFCVFSPGVHISGGCNIGSHCFFGTGCVVLPKVNIGKNVVVGAGAVVINNVSDNETVVGVPSKSINRFMR